MRHDFAQNEAMGIAQRFGWHGLEPGAVEHRAHEFAGDPRLDPRPADWAVNVGTQKVQTHTDIGKSLCRRFFPEANTLPGDKGAGDEYRPAE